MASAMRIALLAMAIMLPLAFADVGPSPPAPTVAVYLVQNGQPETSITNITYNCLGAETYESGAVEPIPTTFECSEGACTNNAGWYYKLNPCFNFPGGHFTYELNGKTIKTENFSFDQEYMFYTMTIDAPTGDITSKSGSDVSTPETCCPPSFILPALLLGAFIRR